MSFAHTARLRSMIIVFTALVLSVSFVAPAEDAPETAYDESESLPCYGTPVVSIAAPDTVGKAPTPRAGAAQLLRTFLRAFGVRRSDLCAGLRCPICLSLIIRDRSFRC